jgi:formylglycine-generating enzyme required for sulfatase activity
LDWCSAKGQTEPHRPVGCVTFSEAEAYCARRGQRLPSAPEWRWASRGGAQAWTYPWGNEPPRHRACFDRGLTNLFGRRTHEPQDSDACPVASFPQGKNPQGVYDLIGNVREWVTTRQPGDRLVVGGSFHEQERDIDGNGKEGQTRRVDAFASQHRSQLADLRARIG